MPVPSSITELSTTPGSNYPTGTESPSSLDDYLRAHAAFIAQNYADRTPVGVVQHFAGTAAPAGWLACTGQAVSRTTYEALFAAIGTTWGAGDGTTTFNLPPADRMLIGAGGLYAAGAVGGNANAIVVAHTHTASAGTQTANHTHSGVTNEAGAHTHSLPGSLPQGGASKSPSAVTDNAGRPESNTTNSAGAHTHEFTTTGVSTNHTHEVTVTSTGASGTNANLPPYAAMLLIIKV